MPNETARGAEQEVRIYWQDRTLRPNVSRHIPHGYVAVADADQAIQRALSMCASLPPRQCERYMTIWLTALGEGFQPSGLLLMSLTALAPILGHASTIALKRFGQFCRDNRALCPVPGKLYPSYAPGSGTRLRCYVVIAPTSQRDEGPISDGCPRSAHTQSSRTSRRPPTRPTY